MASELAQLESQTTSSSQAEAEPEKEDVDFEFNGNIYQVRDRYHRHSKVLLQMRRISSNPILRAPTKRKRAVMKNRIPSRNVTFRKKNER